MSSLVRPPLLAGPFPDLIHSARSRNIGPDSRLVAVDTSRKEPSETIARLVASRFHCRRPGGLRRRRQQEQRRRAARRSSRGGMLGHGARRCSEPARRLPGDRRSDLHEGARGRYPPRSSRGTTKAASRRDTTRTRKDSRAARATPSSSTRSRTTTPRSRGKGGPIWPSRAAQRVRRGRQDLRSHHEPSDDLALLSRKQQDDKRPAFAALSALSVSRVVSISRSGAARRSSGT